MCTVTYYKDKNNTIITSNRDENINRPYATKPRKLIDGNNWVYYPIDPQSNGTWFGVKNDKSVFVLLNGADMKHIPNPPYRKSRGLILLDILHSPDYSEEWENIDLSGIEPFTIIAFVNMSLTQLRWNGSYKTIHLLDPNIEHIWSSSTLYNQEVMQKRKDWFAEFLYQKRNINADDLMDFHSNTQKADAENGLIINRMGITVTRNITQYVLENENLCLTHLDLITKEKTVITETLS